MAKPTSSEIEDMGGMVEPFERRNKKTGSKSIPLTGETVLYPSFNATNGNIPNDVVTVQIKDVATYNNYPLSPEDKVRKTNSTYLWLINEEGFFILLEGTPNNVADRKCICHTNISGGKRACQGGELWFLNSGDVVINFQSGRYGGDSLETRAAAKKYIQGSVGYNVIELLED